VRSVLYFGCPSAERAEAEKLLAAADVAVVWADTVPHALTELQHRDMPVLLDLTRGAAALQVARELRTHRASTLMFAVVDPRRPDLTTEAVLAGMADVFARPLGGHRVASAIDRERAYELHESAADADGGGDTLYTHSAAMRDVMALIARAATMRAGVMIRGEEGTGRQVTARAIHNAQAPARGPFVRVDCGAYEGDQLDAELFGLAVRSSSNADHPTRGLERVNRQSRLFAARHGTLYLQNVAEAPTRVQARLARLLRDREAVLVESRETISLDVRPMAGVDLGVDRAVHEGRVRDDLFRRLSVIRIEVPALRNRREDIAPLANYFVREICGSLHMPPKTLSRPALSLIAALPWRGNATELRALLETIVTSVAGGRGIVLEDVLGHVRLDGGSVVYAATGSLRQARARFEREYIAQVLEQHHGRISEAAKALGIQRTNLYRKMRSLRVIRDRTSQK
jgi:two-component system nitrogen regulation response regulator NtrX